jgi:hypothetical protein
MNYIQEEYPDATGGHAAVEAAAEEEVKSQEQNKCK